MRALLLSLVLALFVVPAPTTRAWGMDVHRRITERALEGLPREIRSFFQSRREFIVERSVDPDLWRIVDLRGTLGPEPPNHFLDIDDLDEPPPFAGVPREWDAFVKRYGAARANRAGRLPWRTADVHGRLVTALKDAGSGKSAYAADNARYLAAILAHYVEDGFQPLHAVGNYDGQLTGQHGLHSRFETVVVERYWTTYALRPIVVTPITDITAFMFDTLVESARLTPDVLAADVKAADGRKVYDEAYYDRLHDATGAIIERRLNEAMAAVAGAIASAWQEAGRPALRD